MQVNRKKISQSPHLQREFHLGAMRIFLPPLAASLSKVREASRILNETFPSEYSKGQNIVLQMADYINADVCQTKPPSRMRNSLRSHRILIRSECDLVFSFEEKVSDENSDLCADFCVDFVRILIVIVVEKKSCFQQH